MKNCPLGVTPMKLVGKLLTTECKENTKIKTGILWIITSSTMSTSPDYMLLGNNTLCI